MDEMVGNQAGEAIEGPVTKGLQIQAKRFGTLF